jgi:hypothetical protein
LIPKRSRPFCQKNYKAKLPIHNKCSTNCKIKYHSKYKKLSRKFKNKDKGKTVFSLLSKDNSRPEVNLSTKFNPNLKSPKRKKLLSKKNGLRIASKPENSNNNLLKAANNKFSRAISSLGSKSLNKSKLKMTQDLKNTNNNFPKSKGSLC